VQKHLADLNEGDFSIFEFSEVQEVRARRAQTVLRLIKLYSIDEAATPSTYYHNRNTVYKQNIPFERKLSSLPPSCKQN
jgi:hypothetical protein